MAMLTPRKAYRVACTNVKRDGWKSTPAFAVFDSNYNPVWLTKKTPPLEQDTVNDNICHNGGLLSANVELPAALLEFPGDGKRSHPKVVPSNHDIGPWTSTEPLNSELSKTVPQMCKVQLAEVAYGEPSITVKAPRFAFQPVTERPSLTQTASHGAADKYSGRLLTKDGVIDADITCWNPPGLRSFNLGCVYVVWDTYVTCTHKFAPTLNINADNVVQRASPAWFDGVFPAGTTNYRLPPAPAKLSKSEYGPANIYPATGVYCHESSTTTVVVVPESGSNPFECTLGLQLFQEHCNHLYPDNEGAHDAYLADFKAGAFPGQSGLYVDNITVANIAAASFRVHSVGIQIGGSLLGHSDPFFRVQVNPTQSPLPQNSSASSVSQQAMATPGDVAKRATRSAALVATPVKADGKAAQVDTPAKNTKRSRKDSKRARDAKESADAGDNADGDDADPGDTKRKYQVEAFVALGNRPEGASIHVKWEHHDDPTWETVKHMKEQLSAATYEQFMTDLRKTFE